MERENEFGRGYAAAVANLIALHGISTEARETFHQNFSCLGDIKKLKVSEFDMDILKKHFK